MLSTKINIVFILFLNRPFLSADPLPLDCDSDITITDCKGMYELGVQPIRRGKQLVTIKIDPFMPWP